MANQKGPVSRILERLGSMKDEPPGTFSLMFTKNRMEEDAKRTREDEDAKVRRHAEIQEKVKLNAARELDEIRNGRSLPPIVWTGKLRELGSLIDGLRKKGLIKAKTRNDAFEQMCRHFVDKKGKAVSARTVLQILRNKP